MGLDRGAVDAEGVWCGEGCPLPPGEGSGELAPFPENFGTFSLETAYFGANFAVYFNRNVRLFILVGPRQLLKYSVSQPPPAAVFEDFFRNSWKFLIKRPYLTRTCRVCS